ncbi:hypothetical protein B0F90DRAFT_1746899 [Multifurca ochricompacta]|uniref:Uncharacterized protein n=1 Tax=Multifurca ochricompacta TaxID=376703 RepID=A0AAD4QIR9_9AGAM|nr:hypothetical protein B0F90DRAFT_1746899 [Multifurca ochricompacta]
MSRFPTGFLTYHHRSIPCGSFLEHFLCSRVICEARVQARQTECARAFVFKFATSVLL